jgi:cell division protein ZipA
MAELRWVLLALGILVIVAIYLLSQGVLQRWLAPLTALRKQKATNTARVEPAVGDAPSTDVEDAIPADPVAPREAPADSIVTLRLIPYAKEVACDKVILALRAAGLKHGRYGIFHKPLSEQSDAPGFSVANLTEPGSFDLSKLTETRIPGMSFFMVLPGEGDPIERFDDMVSTARILARDLNGELRDDKGSSWSIQRERYVREEIIEYCHLHDKRLPD